MRSTARMLALTMVIAAAAGCAGAPARADPAPAAPPQIFAQHLVEIELAGHPELKIIAFHVTPPGAADNVIIASNIGRIGKKADADDLSVLASGAPRMEVTRTGYSVEQVLRDARGRTIGVLGTTFAYAPGDDTTAVVQRAETVRDELAAAIPDIGALFRVSP